MKLKLEYCQVQYFNAVTQWGLQAYESFDDPLAKTMLRDAVGSLIIKLARTHERIRKALPFQKPGNILLSCNGKAYLKKRKPKTIIITFTSSEAYCLNILVEYWNEKVPNTVEYNVIKELFNQQIALL